KPAVPPIGQLPMWALCDAWKSVGIFGPRRIGLLDLFFFHLSHQRRRMDSENPAGLGFVISGGGQHLVDVIVLKFAKADKAMPVSRDFACRFGHVVLADFFRQI